MKPQPEKLKFIAEISCNHKQDFGECIKLIIKAKEVGCDAVKFQCYTPESLTIDCDNEYFKIKDFDFRRYGLTLYDLYKRTCTPKHWFLTLFSISQEIGIDVYCTPFSEQDFYYLEMLGCPAYKIAAYEANDFSFVQEVVKSRKEVLLSVGQLTPVQIQSLYSKLGESSDRVIPFYSVSKHPTSLIDINPRTLTLLTSQHKRLGFSDHSLDKKVTIAAITLGATIIEKHFTLDKNTADGHFSVMPYEMETLIKECNHHYQELFTIKEDNKVYNRSIFAVKDIASGEQFTDDNVRIIRPSDGLPPDQIGLVLASKASMDIKRGTPISKEHLQDV